MSVKSVWPQIVGQAWADEKFRQRLIADPKRTLEEYGITLSDGQEVEILSDTPEKTHLVLPPKPADLDDLAGSAVHTVFGQCTGDIHHPPEPGQCTGDEHKHKPHRHHHHHHPHQPEPGTCTCQRRDDDDEEPGTCTCQGHRRDDDDEERGTCTCRHHR